MIRSREGEIVANIFGVIGSLELLAGALLMMRFGEGKAFYLAIALTVLGMATLFVAADWMENSTATVQ
ncbi:hypothetical protein MGN01_34260 [Methylobacterium gnaphalii]|uniref:DoxX family protein n=1 Tax=Methylobacterium gnaphalii TaxID=1010610 RepID=A0A512JNP5_9HYPH|nr:hypothetical protein MGN01_34260 [Methylobacterium gnaphalii]GLS47216.1 hypothetical protein GCM10007885_00600 [Methylobacterium gnaphalii]